MIINRSHKHATGAWGKENTWSGLPENTICSSPSSAGIKWGNLMINICTCNSEGCKKVTPYVDSHFVAEYHPFQLGTILTLTQE